MRSPEEDEYRARMAITQTKDASRPKTTIGSINNKPFLRVYYWYTNTPGERPGGPWWYRDFPDEAALNEFLHKQLALMHAYALSRGDEGVNLDETRPPTDAWLWRPGTVAGYEGVWRVVNDPKERAELYCD